MLHFTFQNMSAFYGPWPRGLGLKYINFKILLFLMCYDCYVCCDKHTKLSFHYLNRPANKMKINFYTGGSFFKKLAFYIVETFEQNNYCTKTL